MAYKRRGGETAHQARERRARDKGYSSYRQYRKAPAQERITASRRLAARDETYARDARGADVTIRNRARARVETSEGTIYTTRDLRRLRAVVRDAPAGAVIQFRVPVRVDAFDRRRRDVRRPRGRDTGHRTITFAASVDDIELGSAQDFADWLDAMVTDGIDSLYAGSDGSLAGPITVVVPR